MKKEHNHGLVKNMGTEIIIEDIGEMGEGIGRVNGFTLFVEGALPGDLVEIKILKLKKNYGFGKLIKIIKPSPSRVIPICPVFAKCGGCTLQHLDYAQQLKYKKSKIENTLKRIGGLGCVTVSDVIGMDNPYNYRNKAQFPVGYENGKAFVGFYAMRSHRIVPVDNCFIQHKSIPQIALEIEGYINENNISVYDENAHSGVIRHILIRTGFTTGDVMVCIVINDKILPNFQELIDKLQLFPSVKSICVNYNRDKTNVILGQKTETLWGDDYISDYIGKFLFKISAPSFFQVNPVQTKTLYDNILALGNFQAQDIVLDAFCGIGTISLYVAKYVKEVWGVEIIQDAIDNAIDNAKINDITNAKFYVGQAELLIPAMFKDNVITPNIVIVDPPRKGCHIDLLMALCSALPEKIIYVSCDCATLARDLKILCVDDGKYTVEKVCAVDCFPMTGHVETIALLKRV